MNATTDFPTWHPCASGATSTMTGPIMPTADDTAPTAVITTNYDYSPMNQPNTPIQAKTPLISTVPPELVLRQYSKWISADKRRIFIVVDAWHGKREYVMLMDFRTEEELWRPTKEILKLIQDKQLLRYE
ncbi:hypothetical protein [Rudanella lutea]|uniref:hypothetical protein n=1 Tax=Rudanella lutea TaxID=451374 RepID=UPI001B7FB077|nr:hypothetical protein [Rudanella lutea]